MNSHALVARLLEDDDTDDARDIFNSYDPSLIPIQDYWDNQMAGYFQQKRIMLNGKVTERVRRRKDDMFDVEYRMRDGRILRVICPPDTHIKVCAKDDLTRDYMPSDLSFAPKHDPYTPLRSDSPDYVVEIPVDKFNWL